MERTTSTAERGFDSRCERLSMRHAAAHRWRPNTCTGFEPDAAHEGHKVAMTGLPLIVPAATEGQPVPGFQPQGRE